MAFVPLFRNLMHAGEPSIIIDSEGITDHQSGHGFIPWHDVTNVAIHSVNGTKMLGIYVANIDRYLSQVSSARRMGMAANEKLGFAPITLTFAGLSPGIKDAINYIDQLKPAGLGDAG